MKRPKINELRENKKETKAIKALAKRTKKIKVTFNLDEDIVNRLKDIADNSGAKYQTLLNTLLKEALCSKSTYEERITSIESELSEIKDLLKKAA
jgi:predicted DNA binding CopG/RHH family protein